MIPLGTLGAVVAMALAAVVAPSATGSVRSDPQQGRTPCLEEGTWQGVADNGFRWMNVITRGTDATKGQLDLAWVVIDPALGGAFANAVRVTPARGVWSRTDGRDARWTWIAYGLDAAGMPAYAIRAHGTHHMPDCDRLQIAYTLEVFLPIQDMATDTPVAVLQGTATETRMTLVDSPSGS